ncbi:type 2 isopentenyl-diphosphate Delta-isomerase [Peptoniphilus stercorisuis]|uniref:Isopentenyl-diphosphate delta-isomerase n=1 Tax=Peptoniphilus stercorisuis TaxID=1436965 RepID=A0ABS4KE19_9FIRM|nr:type 2 isopentenyl-diphosphate Delta-isomerase [Peptoniphilus stercorisuis]MBP2025997.1 isopentenyl-diphosphate delta-isomerase [Peptoniphilus stercorisuis]
MRKYRKREHIENYLRTTFVGNPMFEDVFLYHNSLPECDFYEIDTSTTFLNKKVDFPLMINAMTGGSDFSEDINESLAEVARKFNIPMAVGSETIALEDEDAKKSFSIVRQIMGDGIVLANLSGRASVEDAKRAIEVVQADGIQIHLNPAQELAMDEGDRSFKNILDNIESIVKGVEVPVIVKEVGFGISQDVAKRLYSVGVRNIDVSGFGGTNFLEVENLRAPENDLSELYSWGIPTAMSLIEVSALNYDELSIISSGGVKSSLDVVKSIVLGASMVGISGEILTYLIHGGYEYTMQYIENLIYKCKMIMTLTGAKNISELKNLDYKVTGKLRELVDYDK